LFALGVALCLLTLTGFLAAWHWTFELTCHFRVSYMLGLATLAALFGIRRHGRVALLFLAFSLPNFLVVAPRFLHPPQAGAGQMLRVLQSNILIVNKDTNAVLRMIRESQADIVLLHELDADWQQRLKPLQEFYPYQDSNTRAGDFGIGVWSKFPIARAEVLALSDSGRTTLHVEIDFTGQTIHLVSTHPPPPMGGYRARVRDQQLLAAADYVGRLQGTRLFLGDFNITPWSPVFGRALKASQLRDSAQGRGIFASWPAQVWWLRIPIDHCLHSADLQIVEKRSLPAVGSDHLPILTDFVLTQP
jgi:endonuclease/exonuclease/phosphatase (EEP) superfamily protein YafD